MKCWKNCHQMSHYFKVMLEKEAILWKKKIDSKRQSKFFNCMCIKIKMKHNEILGTWEIFSSFIYVTIFLLHCWPISHYPNKVKPVGEGDNDFATTARNLVSISSTFYVQIFHANIVLAAFSTFMESCQNDVRTKNSYVKCWWNWRLVTKMNNKRVSRLKNTKICLT